MIEVKISKEPLNPNNSFDLAAHDNTGCINIFLGKVRNRSYGKIVKYLDYEVYENMALSEMQKIAKKAKKRWDIEDIIVHHREGRVKAGEIPVLVAVTASHRKDAIIACKYIIDTLKKTVPIWKKEVFENGEEWVSNHS